MTPDSREEKQSLAFLDYIAGSAGYKLRPVGYLTLEQLGLLELRISKGKEASDLLSPDEVLDEVNAFLFVQAAPLPVVSRAIRSYRSACKTQPRNEAFVDFVVEHVEPFLASLTPESKESLVEQFESLGQIDAARVVAEPPPGHKPDPSDPNC